MKKAFVSLLVLLGMVFSVAPVNAEPISGALTPKSEQVVPMGKLERAAGTDCSRTKMIRDRKLFYEDSSAIIEIFYKICANRSKPKNVRKWVRNGSMTLYYNFLLDDDETLCGPSLFRGFNYKQWFQDPYGRNFTKNHTIDCENDTVGRRHVSLMNTTRLFYIGSGAHPSERPKWHADVTMKWDLGIPDETKTFTDRYARRIR